MRCGRLLVPINLALVTALWSTSCLYAQPQTIEQLQQLFETDPATAFEEAGRMFQEPMQRGDLGAMMSIVRALAPQACEYYYALPFDDMADAARQVATEAGDWSALGEVHLLSAWVHSVLHGLVTGGHQDARRAVYHAERAKAAYAKAGEENPGADEIAQQVQGYAELAGWVTGAVDRLPAAWEERVMAVQEADRGGNDAEAVEGMGALLREALQDPNVPANQVASLLTLSASAVRLRTGSRLLPLMRELIEQRFPDGNVGYEFHAQYSDSCIKAWSGRHDAFYREYYWCMDTFDPTRSEVPIHLAKMSHKLRRFGGHQEAINVVARYTAMIRSRGTVPSFMVQNAVQFVFPETPPRLANELWEIALLYNIPNNNVHSFRLAPSLVISNFEREGVDPPYALLAEWLISAAVQLEDQDSKATVAAEAVSLLQSAGLEQDASALEQLLASLTEGDTEAGLKCALIVAKHAIRTGEWEEVLEKLGPAAEAAESAPCAALVQSMFVLEQANRALGKDSEADALRKRLTDLVERVSLGASERISYLISLAAASDDPTTRRRFLDEAHETAQQSNVAGVEEAVAVQLAQAALASGDLGTAKSTLLELVAEQESKRERLAFDPLLRQQWFADSLGSYRKLLKVAALQRDAALALDCAERMRSRALLDQLAWRKVDMGVKLDKATQERLAALRETRRSAYSLLQRAMGGGSSVLSEDERGMYMPIRGLYMPIRGPLDEAKPITEEEVAQLKALIEKLGAEEAALESAIREQVPAYSMAAQAQIPTADELAAVLAQDPKLAVLEYTLCDDGVVIVGMRGGKRPMVWLVDESPESLLEHITSFRERIWQRREEVKGEAQWLYTKLVTPMEGLLVGAERLWVVGDGAIQLVPFGALQDVGGRYLAERMAVAYAPSLSLPLMSRGERGKAELSALVVAAPETGAIESLGGDEGRGLYMPIRGLYMPIRGPQGVSSALTSMAMVPLPGAKVEGESVVAQFAGASLLTGAEATKRALIDQGSKCDVLHIATHGYADPEVPEFSGLLLAGTGEEPYSVLTAQEVYLWDLQARLVTLSACQTGMGRSVEGEGLLGLTRAFIYAGAQDVVCSLWPVADQSTQKLMGAFYANLKTSATVEEALTQAQRSLLADEATKHPFYWAAFVPVRGSQ